RMPVCRLERNEARVNAMTFEAVLQTTIRLSRRDRQQPIILFQAIEQLEYAVEQRLLDLACGTQLPEGAFVILGEPHMLFRRRIREQRGHGFDQAKSDHPPADLRRRKLQTILPKCLRKRRTNGRAAVDERAVA